MELRGYRKNIIIFILTLILSMFVFSLVNTKEKVEAQSRNGCFTAMESLWNRTPPVGINSFDEYLARGICTDNTNSQALTSCGCNDETVNGTFYDFNIYNDPTCNQAGGVGPTLQRCRVDNGLITPTNNLTPAQSSLNASLNTSLRSIPQYGAMCEINYVDCSAEFGGNGRNLFEDIKTGYIRLSGLNLNLELFSEYMLSDQTGYNVEDNNRICYNSSIYGKDIIMINLADRTDGSDLGPSGIGYLQLSEGLGTATSTGFDLLANSYITFCPTGTGSTPGVNTFGVDLGPLKSSQRPVNCCPPGYTFANKANTFNLGGAHRGVCCKGNPNEISGGDVDRCIFTDGTEITTTESSNNLAITDQPIYGGGSSWNFIFFETVNVSQIWGLPLTGQAKNNTVRLATGTSTNETCPPNYPANSCVTPENPDLDTRIYKRDEYNQNNGWQCSKCYLEGEAIRLDQENKKLHICDTSVAENYRTEDLINNSVQDTLAFLQADEQNQPLLQLCREQGGLYIAIGCVDPTPIGIITGAIRISFGVLGGVALLQIILAGIAYQSGQEARIQTARNRVFATLGGVALLVFSVLILRIIGVNVLDVVPSTFF